MKQNNGFFYKRPLILFSYFDQIQYNETLSFLLSAKRSPTNPGRHQDHLPFKGLQPEPLGRGHPHGQQLLPD